LSLTKNVEQWGGDNVVVQKVKDKFYSGESSIYERSGGFDYTNKSIVGTHSLYITNKGRVFVHDTGGIFGSEQVLEYDAMIFKIKVTFLDTQVKIENAKSSNFSFDFTIEIDDFIKLFRDVPKDIFQLNDNKQYPCYVKFDNQYRFEHMDIKINDKKIELRSNHNQVKIIPLYQQFLVLLFLVQIMTNLLMKRKIEGMEQQRLLQ
jgi:hypothetical protein